MTILLFFWNSLWQYFPIISNDIKQCGAGAMWPGVTLSLWFNVRKELQIPLPKDAKTTITTHFIFLRYLLLPLKCPSWNISISKLVKNILSSVELRTHTNETLCHFLQANINVLFKKEPEYLAWDENRRRHLSGGKPRTTAYRQYHFIVWIRISCRPLIRLVCWTVSNTTIRCMQNTINFHSNDTRTALWLKAETQPLHSTLESSAA